MRYVLYVLYVAYTAYTPYTTYNIMWLAYHSLLHSSTGSILDRAYINQLASYNSSLSSYNIVLKASVTKELIKAFIYTVYKLHGAPNTIISNRGSLFISNF